MHRFFMHPSNIQGDQVIIQGTDVKHMRQVLRLKKGDQVLLANGEGLEYKGTLVGGVEGGLLFSLSKPNPSTQESPLVVHLYQALIRSKPLDLVIQKATELGVSSIHPVVTERSVVFLPEDRKRKRYLRWQKIAEEAAKQSQRAFIPMVGEVLSFDYALERAEKTLGILPTLHPIAKNSFLSLSPVKELSLFIGPEGGFTPKEVSFAKEKGLKIIGLGPRVLRSETAAIVTVAILNYLWGDGDG